VRVGHVVDEQLQVEFAELHSGGQVERGVVTDFLSFFLQVVVEAASSGQVAAQEAIVFPVAVIVLQAQGGVVVGNAGQDSNLRPKD
jgi:hypothetical protein